MFRRGRGRSGRPSLLGTAARTAVVVGTAQAVSGSVAQSQAVRAQDRQDAEAFRQQAQPVAPPPAAPVAAAAPAVDTDTLIAQLTQLGELHKAGVLTDQEFAAQKARLLG
ncbi:SHOCT domain-containing protein [Nakamurella silvestris]|nr:SHOCT domain-containing protein [Nakamurella silvestris]